MTTHLCTEINPDCYRCDLSLGEVPLAARHGLLVAAARQSIPLSQTALADLAGCAQQTISRIEKGEQATSDALKVRIAAALGKKVGELFSLDEEEK